MLSRLARAVASIGPENTSVLPLTRLLHTTGISSDNDAKGTVAGSAGSEGAAPGRFAGSDEDVKFGDKDACEHSIGDTAAAAAEANPHSACNATCFISSGGFYLISI
jgi:hypothetical protein